MKTKKAKARDRKAAHDIDPNRKLISRREASRIIGCSIMTLKRMETRSGGILDAVKLRPDRPQAVTYYRVAEINAAFGIDVNAPNKAA